jgi:hypothetical protein
VVLGREFIIGRMLKRKGGSFQLDTDLSKSITKKRIEVRVGKYRVSSLPLQKETSIGDWQLHADIPHQIMRNYIARPLQTGVEPTERREGRGVDCDHLCTRRDRRGPNSEPRKRSVVDRLSCSRT